MKPFTSPSLEQLAAELGITVEDVESRMQEAVDAGYLQVLDDDGEAITLLATFPDEELKP